MKEKGKFKFLLRTNHLKLSVVAKKCMVFRIACVWPKNRNIYPGESFLPAFLKKKKTSVGFSARGNTAEG